MGVITIKDPVGKVTTATDDGWVRLGIGNFDKQTFVVDANVHGDGLNPIVAHIANPIGETIAANVDATINGGVTPLTATIEGGATPVSAAVTASLTAPIDVSLGDIGLRNTTVKFKLFGVLTILTMEIGP